MTTTEPPLDQARRMLRLMPRWHRWVATTLQTSPLGQELSLRQLGVLYLIREGMMSPGLLSRRLWVTPAVVTGLIDRLEQRGFVRREPDPADRRRQRLVLTETGLATSEAVERTLAEALADQLGAPGSPRLAEVDRALDIFEETLAALVAHMPASIDLDPGDEDAAPAALGNVRAREQFPHASADAASVGSKLATLVAIPLPAIAAAPVGKQRTRGRSGVGVE